MTLPTWVTNTITHRTYNGRPFSWQAMHSRKTASCEKTKRSTSLQLHIGSANYQEVIWKRHLRVSSTTADGGKWVEEGRRPWKGCILLLWTEDKKEIVWYDCNETCWFIYVFMENTAYWHRFLFFLMFYCNKDWKQIDNVSGFSSSVCCQQISLCWSQNHSNYFDCLQKLMLSV